MVRLVSRSRRGRGRSKMRKFYQFIFLSSLIFLLSLKKSYGAREVKEPLEEVRKEIDDAVNRIEGLLRQPLDFSVDDGDALCLRTLGQTRHAEHVAGNGHNHLRAAVEDDVADADGEALR